MTNQEIFTKVVRHLLTQMRKAVDPHERYGHCRYRGPNGTRCAIGCLISDQAYSPSIEYLSVEDPPVITALEKSGVKCDAETSQMLSILQTIHDEYFPEYWKDELEQVAQAYGFEMPLVGDDR